MNSQRALLSRQTSAALATAVVSLLGATAVVVSDKESTTVDSNRKESQSKTKSHTVTTTTTASLSNKSHLVKQSTVDILQNLPLRNVTYKTPHIMATSATMASTSSNDNKTNQQWSTLRRRRTIQDILHDTASPPQRRLSEAYNVDWQHPLGQGTFGAVYYGINKENNQPVAVKKISKRFTDDATFQREMQALLHLQTAGGHPNICGLQEHFENETDVDIDDFDSQDEYYYLILDLVSGGEMFEHLSANGAYSEADAARLVREIACALDFIHGLGIVHGDLKPENLMLSSTQASDAVMKIVDFGSAQTDVYDDDDDDDDDKRYGTANTPAYSPPEVLDGSNHRLESSYDMWALGVIIYIMLTGVHPFDLYGNATDEEIADKVRSGEKPPLGGSPLMSHLSPEAVELIEQLIQWEPSKRLSAFELLQNPWVRGETARTIKMADSDKRLASFRAFRTKLCAKVFADMVSISADDDTYINIVEHDDDDDDNNKNNNDNNNKDSNNSSNNNKNGKHKTGKNNNGNALPFSFATGRHDSVTKRTSLLERSFQKLDPTHRGYITTDDLQGLGKGDVGDEKNKNTKKTNKKKKKKDSDDDEGLSLSGFSDLLAENMKNRYFPKGHVIYKKGDVGNVMYFLNSGVIEVSTNDGSDIKDIRKSGDFFGEGALLHPQKIRSATIRCLTPVHAIEVGREYFEKYIASEGSAILNLREKDKSRKKQRAKTLLKLQQNLQPKLFNNGDYIFRVGEEGKEMYVIEEGHIQLATNGRNFLQLKEGDMCGEHSLIFNRARNVDAQCVTNTSDGQCKVLVLSARDFYSLLDLYPALKDSIRDICNRRDFQKALCAKTKRPFPETESDLQEAFKQLDVNNSNHLELPMLRSIIHNFDPNYTEDDIQQILKSLDLDESGRVSWAEFRRIFGHDDVSKSQKRS